MVALVVFIGVVTFERLTMDTKAESDGQTIRTVGLLTVSGVRILVDGNLDDLKIYSKVPGPGYLVGPPILRNGIITQTLLVTPPASTSPMTYEMPYRYGVMQDFKVPETGATVSYGAISPGYGDPKGY